MAEPYCLAMVLCDAIHRDQATGKFTILGTFSTLGAGDYPADLLCFVYFAITDGQGKVSVSIRIVESSADLTDEGAVIFESKAMQVDFQDPLMVLEVAVMIVDRDEAGQPCPVKIPRPGLYHCELYANSEVLMSRRLLAVGTADPHGEPEHE